MFNKKKDPKQNVDVWGEPTLEGEPLKPTRQKTLDKMESKIDALPAEQRNKRYLALTAGVVAICLLAFIGAAITTCSVSSGMSREAAIDSVLEDGSSSSSSSSSKAEDPTLYFTNLSALTNLSEDSQKKFATEFREFATEKGNNPQERVKCYSRIDGSGSNSTFWVSCPIGQQYYKVDFNNETKGFTFTACDLPENLPEVNYEAINAAKTTPATTLNEDGGVANTSSNDVKDTTTHTILVPITSANDVATIWSAEAANALPAAVDGFVQSKGRTIDFSRSSVDLPSARTENGATTVTIHCVDGNSNQYDIEATWDTTQNAFGMKLL